MDAWDWKKQFVFRLDSVVVQKEFLADIADQAYRSSLKASVQQNGQRFDLSVGLLKDQVNKCLDSVVP